MKKLELKPTQSVEIDWSKPQWMQSVSVPSQIVLTTGEHGEKYFSGTMLPCVDTPHGMFAGGWYKESFQPLQGEIPFIISNND